MRITKSGAEYIYPEGSINMREFFNDYVQSLETYIMFRIKETVAKLTPELIAKNRAPIMLSMGAPTAAPPKKVVDALKAALDEKGAHLYSTPKGEKYLRDAIAKRMKTRFNVELNPDTEIFSLIGSNIANGYKLNFSLIFLYSLSFKTLDLVEFNIISS